MKIIWKWRLEPETTIRMPQDAKVLDVQVQDNEPQLWALLDTDSPDCSRTFRSFSTGVELPDNPGEYVDTFQLGELVFHVFEIHMERD